LLVYANFGKNEHRGASTSPTNAKGLIPTLPLVLDGHDCGSVKIERDLGRSTARAIIYKF